MVEPVVWLPRASGTMPAATAAAEPLEEPPGVWAGLCGLRVLPGWRVANSVVTVLPMMTAPAPRSIATTLASRDGVRPAWSAEPFSVGMSAVSMMSLMPTGTPCKRPEGPAGAAELVGRARLRQRMVRVEKRPRLDVAVDLAHAVQARLNQLLGSDRPLPDQPRRLPPISSYSLSISAPLPSLRQSKTVDRSTQTVTRPSAGTHVIYRVRAPAPPAQRFSGGGIGGGRRGPLRAYFP